MPASKFDPHLHILRTVVNSLEDPKQRQETQSARFKLFEALEADDAALASYWLEALEVSLIMATISDARLREAGSALNAIRRGLAESHLPADAQTTARNQAGIFFDQRRTA